MTHRWWGSVSFLGEMRTGRPADAAYITPDPINARITERGVRLGSIPAGLRADAGGFLYPIPDPFAEVFDGIAIGNSEFADLEGRLKDFSDGSVTVEWASADIPVMDATFCSSPYVFSPSTPARWWCALRPDGRRHLHEHGDHLQPRLPANATIS